MTVPDVLPWLGRWPQVAGGRPRLINVSENHTFRVDGPGATDHVLRLHRPGYQSRRTILGELAWLAALRRETDLPVPRPLPGGDGAALQEVAPERFAVLFALEPGREPTLADDLVPLFGTLGRFAATAHRHVRGWTRPTGFLRQVWNAQAVLDADGPWGDWRRAPRVVGRTRDVLDALDRRLRADLAAYGTGPERFGLIHADMRLANLLLAPDRVTLIDFDDCGFCWFVYDLAASLSFIELDPRVPALKAAWIAGYTALRPLGPTDLRAIDTMILLRRMALLAWIGSHRRTELARAHAGDFAAGTAELATAYFETPPL